LSNKSNFIHYQREERDKTSFVNNNNSSNNNNSISLIHDSVKEKMSSYSDVDKLALKPVS